MSHTDSPLWLTPIHSIIPTANMPMLADRFVTITKYYKLNVILQSIYSILLTQNYIMVIGNEWLTFRSSALSLPGMKVPGSKIWRRELSFSETFAPTAANWAVCLTTAAAITTVMDRSLSCLATGAWTVRSSRQQTLKPLGRAFTDIGYKQLFVTWASLT